jgi:regulator of sirC expression with transglutaminase-like and TPR domain
MGQSPILTDSVLSQLYSFLAYLFPFLGSVAFTLFLRKMDRFNSLMNQIHIQKQALRSNEEELEDVRNELSTLVNTFNSSLDEKMEDVVRSFQKKYNDLNSLMFQQWQLSHPVYHL